MSELTERDYDVMRVGNRYRIRRPTGEILRGLGRRIITFDTEDEARDYIRALVGEKK